jgi:large subunit ribosomal protein L9e
MVKILSGEQLKIPKGVKVEAANRVITVTGPRGTLKKDLRHLMLDFRIKNKGTNFTVTRWFGKRIDIACINTALATVRNMINGVTKGFRFKLRFAYAHFPINVSVDGQTVEIRNFLGEKRVRRHSIPKSIKVYRTDQAKVKDELVLEGNDLLEVSQVAAQLHEQCLVKNKDIRMFLDGIYVQTKEFVSE